MDPGARSSPTHAALTTAMLAALALAALAARPARAEVDDKCYNQWNGALLTLQVGQKCGYLDAGAVARIKQAQDARMQCAQSKANAEEKTAVAKNAAAAQRDAAQRVAQMQCGADVRKAFDAQVSSLAR